MDWRKVFAFLFFVARNGATVRAFLGRGEGVDENMIVNHKITMDLMDPEVGQKIYVVQEDRYSRVLEL